MQSLRRLGAFAVAERAERCLLIVDSAVGETARGMAEESLQQAGVLYKVHSMQRDFRWPHGAQVRDAVEAAEDFSPNAIVGFGAGATLDVSKAVAGLYGRPFGRRERLRDLDRLLSGRGPPLEPPNTLPTLLVPSTRSVASTSGRVLVLPEGNDAPMCLVPLVVAGPRAVGVGVGLQARRVVADPTVAAESAAAPSTAAAVAHALSIFVDSAASAAGTLKAKMLWDDIAEGLTSTRTALSNPAVAHIDALLATLAAGQAAADSDANAYGGLCCLHELSCIAAVAWKELPFASVSACLLPPVLRAWSEHATEAEQESLERVASAILMREGSTVADLADWVTTRLLAADVPRLGQAPANSAAASASASASAAASSSCTPAASPATTRPSPPPPPPPSATAAKTAKRVKPTKTATKQRTKRIARTAGEAAPHLSSSHRLLVDPKLDAAVLALRAQEVLGSRQRRCPEWLMDPAVLAQLFFEASLSKPL